MSGLYLCRWLLQETHRLERQQKIQQQKLLELQQVRGAPLLFVMKPLEFIKSLNGLIYDIIDHPTVFITSIIGLSPAKAASVEGLQNMIHK